ncbi:unnamed protein product [Chondrus crispus]|uniref:Uncharacterized protein n=1 Tax=Chondrus crispus TaxID=2769 RepID=R7Q6N2_CHOCR|nr:unnamed protein product [Chondrus crispus]CDF33694.1 unnamed protein product [Chondrus crispus]|eukprot:XP_005713513.1 unnamed protein product [Chondrus crispus]
MRASLSKRVRPNKRRRRRCARPHPDALCLPPPSPALPCACARPSPPHVWTALVPPPRSSRVADASPPRPGLQQQRDGELGRTVFAAGRVWRRRGAG